MDATERFKQKLIIGENFEKRAHGILKSIFHDCDVFDTSTVQRVDDRRFPDFLVSKNDKPIYLVDAKFKKVYQKDGEKYLQVSQDFIDDYLYHANAIGCKCAIIFGVNEHSNTNKGDVYLVENVADNGFRLMDFNNEHGDSPSCWYDIKTLKTLISIEEIC